LHPGYIIKFIIYYVIDWHKSGFIMTMENQQKPEKAKDKVERRENPTLGAEQWDKGAFSQLPDSHPKELKPVTPDILARLSTGKTVMEGGQQFQGAQPKPENQGTPAKPELQGKQEKPEQKESSGRHDAGGKEQKPGEGEKVYYTVKDLDRASSHMNGSTRLGELVDFLDMERSVQKAKGAQGGKLNETDYLIIGEAVRQKNKGLELPPPQLPAKLAEQINWGDLKGKDGLPVTDSERKVMAHMADWIMRGELGKIDFDASFTSYRQMSGYLAPALQQAFEKAGVNIGISTGQDEATKSDLHIYAKPGLNGSTIGVALTHNGPQIKLFENKGGTIQADSREPLVSSTPAAVLKKIGDEASAVIGVSRPGHLELKRTPDEPLPEAKEESHEVSEAQFPRRDVPEGYYGLRDLLRATTYLNGSTRLDDCVHFLNKERDLKAEKALKGESLSKDEYARISKETLTRNDPPEEPLPKIPAKLAEQFNRGDLKGTDGESISDLERKTIIRMADAILKGDMRSLANEKDGINWRELSSALAPTLQKAFENAGCNIQIAASKQGENKGDLYIYPKPGVNQSSVGIVLSYQGSQLKGFENKGGVVMLKDGEPSLLSTPEARFSVLGKGAGADIKKSGTWYGMAQRLFKPLFEQ
jgi:hypothetical protein